MSIEGTRIGTRVAAMFGDAHKAANMMPQQDEEGPVGNLTFPQAQEREFVMRVRARRPAAYSDITPQFLRAVLSKHEFRLCGAFTEDIAFF